jgi:3-phosphoglycerate kinase
LSSAAYSALGGGDRVATTKAFGLAKKADYVCAAGGGMVRFWVASNS